MSPGWVKYLRDFYLVARACERPQQAGGTHPGSMAGASNSEVLFCGGTDISDAQAQCER